MYCTSLYCRERVTWWVSFSFGFGVWDGVVFGVYGHIEYFGFCGAGGRVAALTRETDNGHTLERESVPVYVIVTTHCVPFVLRKAEGREQLTDRFKERFVFMGRAWVAQIFQNRFWFENSRVRVAAVKSLADRVRAVERVQYAQTLIDIIKGLIDLDG